MTTADRVFARGRSLSFDWGTLPPNAPSRPSPCSRLGRTASVLQPGDFDYATYAPPGTNCADCNKPIKSTQVARRTDSPNVTYRHFPEDCPAKEKS